MAIITPTQLKAIFVTGAIPTQAQFASLIDSSKQYTSYVALLNQTSTSAPVATVLENTFSGAIVWAYSGAGFYTGTLTGAFSATKTYVIVGQVSDVSYVSAYRYDDNTIIVKTSDSNDDELINTAIEIRVYP